MVVSFFIGMPQITHAQNPPVAQTSSPDSTELIIRRLNFEGNDHVSSSTLETLVRTQTNREFLGIPGFTPWYYIWQLTDESFGEEPAYLNYETVAADLERIARYYNSIGFLEASADSSITVYEEDKVKVKFIIDEGTRSQIESVSYSGLPDSAFVDSVAKTNFYKASSITEELINDSTFKSDIPYVEAELDLERNRIIDYLKNNGYAAIKPDSITALVKRTDNNDYLLDVLYLVNPGRKYNFGDLSIKLAGPGTDSTYQESDTLQGPPHTTNDKKIYLWKEESAQSKFSLLTSQILFQPGTTFNNERYIRSVNEFQNLGMVSIRQFGLSEDGTQPDYSGDEIPVYFSLQTLPKHSINFNVFGLRRYGYGSGTGVTYTNNNLFGRGENLQIGVNGSFEYVSENRLNKLPNSFTDSTNRTSGSRIFQRYEGRIDFSLPRLAFPFASLDENLFFANSRTRYSLAYNRSNQLLFDINYNLSFTQQFEVKHNSRFTSFIDLLNLEVLDANPSNRFVDALCREYGDINDTDICDEDLIPDDSDENTTTLEQILEDFRPQFSSVLRYAFRSQRTDLIKRNYGYFSEYSIAVGGNVPYLVDRFVESPDTLEGTLRSPTGNDLAYSRYFKITGDYRRYLPLGTNTVFANRGYLGYARPYGGSRTIPLNQRFYAGGSNDIRGWNIFDLGPGAIENVTINGGEVKLLAQTELRQTAFKNFMSSNWILALFADAGNIWYGNVDKFQSDQTVTGNGQIEQNEVNIEDGKFKFDEFYNQVAIGSGFGLRLDFNYLVARIDLAFRVHEPGGGWFKDSTPTFHFGIGHSF